MKGKQKKKLKDGLERRYELKRRGLPVTREKVKKRIKAKSNKIKRYQSRNNRYQQSLTFKNNQGKFQRELNSEERHYETTDVPDKEETQEFWKSIRGAQKFKRDFEYKEEQEGVEMTPEKIKGFVRQFVLYI